MDWRPFDGRKLYGPYYDAPQRYLRALSYALYFGPIEGQEDRLFELLNARDMMAK